MSTTKNLLDEIVEKVKDEEIIEEKLKKDKKKIIKAEEVSDSSTMEDLLLLSDDNFVNVGDVIEGTVLDISSNITLVDIGPIGTGIVIGREAKSGLSEDEKIKIGSKINASVISLDTEDGYIELSIREASYGRAWNDLQVKKENKEVVSTKILDANRGGLMVEINGIMGFLPVSQLSSENYPRVEDGDKAKILEILKNLVGKELGVRILDVEQDDEKLIVSEKAAYSERERKVISDLSVGDVVKGHVSGVVDFGAFVKFFPKSSGESQDSKSLEGLVHISELAWQLIDNPREIIKVGDKVKAKIIGIDDTRISLSIKALIDDPWSQIKSKYKVGEIYKGKVDKINHFGAFVYLDSDIHGLAHISEFQEKFPNKKINEKIESGKEYMWKVISIEPKEHRMGLVLVDGDEKVEDGIKSKKKSKEKVTEK